MHRKTERLPNLAKPGSACSGSPAGSPTQSPLLSSSSLAAARAGGVWVCAAPLRFLPPRVVARATTMSLDKVCWEGGKDAVAEATALLDAGAAITPDIVPNSKPLRA